MQFTYVDAIVAAVTALSAFLAYSRGFTREVFAIGGWIVAALFAFYLAPTAAPLVAEIPWLGPKLAESCLILMIAAFSLIVAVGLLVLGIFVPVLASVISDSVLRPIDRVLGFLFGIARGLLLIAVGFLIYTNFAAGEDLPTEVENAWSRGVFEESAEIIDEYRPREVPPWLEARVDALIAPCEGDAQEEVVLPETDAPAAPAE